MYIHRRREGRLGFSFGGEGSKGRCEFAVGGLLVCPGQVHACVQTTCVFQMLWCVNRRDADVAGAILPEKTNGRDVAAPLYLLVCIKPRDEERKKKEQANKGAWRVKISFCSQAQAK